MLWAQLAVIAICMIGEAFFSGMETGLISIHRMRLRHLLKEKRRGARLLQNFIDHPDRLLGTTLVGTNICVETAAILAASVATALLGPWGNPLSGVVMTILLVALCEYLPKAWFQSQPLRRCLLFVVPLRLSWIVLRPIGAVITAIAKLLVPKGRDFSRARTPFVTRDELKLLAREGEKNGVLSPAERQMIHRVFELSGKTAREIMIPREKMVSVNSSTLLPDLLKTAKSAGVTRLPVYDNEESHFVGIVNIFDVFTAPDTNHEATVADYMRPARFIQERMPVDEILPQMRLLRQQMCLVTADDLQVTGLVTTEDVLEEIVGQL
ncbi:MAG: HlyC/CorC family transporter [Kiritimatiellae bacterium]|nr:HlyC/CorC family transporter [Kiritimatiellia bacterium]